MIYIQEKFYIKLCSVSKKYGNATVLDKISLSIPKGKIVSLVGDNGSGKSTLAKIISGEIRPNEGYIDILGSRYDKLTTKLAIKSGISMIYQDLSLDDQLDVPGNIFLGQELKRYGMILDFKRMNQVAHELIDQLEINIPYLSTPVGLLSGGQRQGVALARSLYQGANMIIADEPTAAMGIKESKATIDFFEKLPAKGYTVLMISHNINHVYRISDEIHIMRSGKIIKSVSKENTSISELEGIINES